MVAELARRGRVDLAIVRSGRRERVISAAPRDLVTPGRYRGDVRPAHVTAYLGIRPPSVTGHMRALRSAAGDKLTS